MGRCEGCKNYSFHDGEYHCIWFDVRIARTFPGWREDFRKGRIKFRGCGFYNL